MAAGTTKCRGYVGTTLCDRLWNSLQRDISRVTAFSDSQVSSVSSSLLIVTSRGGLSVLRKNLRPISSSWMQQIIVRYSRVERRWPYNALSNEFCLLVVREPAVPFRFAVSSDFLSVVGRTSKRRASYADIEVSVAP